MALPAGRAVRRDVLAWVPVAELAHVELHSSLYSVATPDGRAGLDHWGYSPPGDRWLSVARTLEITPWPSAEEGSFVPEPQRAPSTLRPRAREDR